MNNFFLGILQGIIIGIANIIPGISGSTLAVILGIYEKIINIITKFDFKLLLLFKKFEFKSIEKHISLKFLISISTGIVISYIFMANLIQYLFANFEKLTWSYFFGIILISSWIVSKYVKKWSIKEIVFLKIGLILSLLIFLINPNIEENQNLLYVFICGVIGVLGMLIPGLSGSYLLYLMGNYELLMSKILLILNPVVIRDYFLGIEKNQFENYFIIFVVFMIGHIFGILILSRSVKWLLLKHKNITFACLTGFILGSLLWIWPWKSQLSNKISLPGLNDISDIYSILLIIAGVITILMIESFGKKFKKI